jgi:hypothetical protein
VPGPLAGGQRVGLPSGAVQRRHLPELSGVVRTGTGCRCPLSLAWLCRRIAG